MTTHETPTSRWFRWVGTLTLVFGGAWFLLDGWSDSHVLSRQSTWAAITLALALSGVVAARRYHDRLGARLCLGLAAATLPLHFAQLGSACFDLSTGRTDLTFAVLLSAAIVLALVPVLALGGAALFRRWAWPFTALLFGLSCPLLLPTRAGDPIALLVAGELLVLVVVEVSARRQGARFESWNAHAARALLFVPLLILLGRNTLHEITRSWVSASLVTLATLLFFTGRRVPLGRSTRGVLDFAVVVCAAVAASMLALTLSTACLAFAGGILLSCAFCHPRSPAQGLVWLGTTTLCALGWWAWFAASPLVTLTALALCGGYLTLAYHRRSASGSVAHLLLAINLVASAAVSLVRFPVSFGWLLPTTLGISLLLLGSSLQSSSSWPRRAWAKLTGHFSPQV